MVLTVIALVVLYLYSFGPLADRRHTAHSNPASLRPTTVQGATAGTNEYHNRDLKENYFRVSIARSWQVKPGKTTGSYSLSFAAGTGSIELMDVPDNSTLELYVLSREEPRLKKEVPGYGRRSYQKLTINGYECCELKYGSTASGAQYETIKTYLSGQDMAGVVTIAAPQKEFASLAQAANAVTTSFHWENP
jgi:hypothetical protein